MKKIIYSIIFAITLLIGGVLFITNKYSNSDTKTEYRDFIVCRGDSKRSAYPFEIAMPKGTTAIEIANRLFEHPEEIYVKKNKTWHAINHQTKIYNDVMMKA